MTDLPHATLLDRNIQWMFNKHEGRYVQLVVSASRSLSEMPRSDAIALALRELAEFFPAAREAKLEKGACGERKFVRRFQRVRDSKRIVLGKPNLRFLNPCSSPETGRNPAGPPPWKALSAAGISRPKQ